MPASIQSHPRFGVRFVVESVVHLSCVAVLWLIHVAMGLAHVTDKWIHSSLLRKEKSIFSDAFDLSDIKPPTHLCCVLPMPTRLVARGVGCNGCDGVADGGSTENSSRNRNSESDGCCHCGDGADSCGPDTGSESINGSGMHGIDPHVAADLIGNNQYHTHPGAPPPTTTHSRAHLLATPLAKKSTSGSLSTSECTHMANIVTMAMQISTQRLTFYRHEGFCSFEMEQVRGYLDAYGPSAVTWQGALQNGATTVASFTINNGSMRVCFCGDSAGRGMIVEAAREAARANVDVTLQWMDSLCSNVAPDIDLVLLFSDGLVPSAVLPWQLRVAEFIECGSLMSFTTSAFSSAIQRYSKCEQRYGK